MSGFKRLLLQHIRKNDQYLDFFFNDFFGYEITGTGSVEHDNSMQSFVLTRICKQIENIVFIVWRTIETK